MEVPYFHGPIYDELGPGLEAAAAFHRLCLPGRLAIDNPLDARRFEREMAGRPAILLAQGPRGRAILFSPHPEMGDLVRKYVALDGYIRHYLPIRGRRTMEETLLAYRPLDSPAFRLVLNAVHALTPAPARRRRRTPAPARREVQPATSVSSLPSFQDAAAELLASVRFPRAGEYGSVVRSLAADLAGRLAPAADSLRKALRLLSRRPGPEARRILSAWNHLAWQAAEVLAQPGLSRRPMAERLMHVELALSLWEAWRRLAEAELCLGPARPPR
jgi:hypothetical protein